MTTPALSFDRTVPRELAHRAAVGEVFVCDSARAGEDEFLLAVQLSRSHRMWSDRRYAYHDPLHTAEAGRQGLFVLLHRYFDVPHGLPMVLRQIGLDVHDLEAYRDGGRAPLDAVFRVRLTDQRYRGGALLGMAFRGDLTVGDAPAMTMTGDIMMLQRGDYDVLRAHARARKGIRDAGSAAPPKPLDPALLGRYDERNVVIGDVTGEGRYPILVDQRHPCFFDHPLDHVPGPLILEAYRQAALVTAYRSGALPSPVAALTRCHVNFADYAEFEAPVECTAAVSATTPTHVALDLALYQYGTRIAEATLALTPC
jgi:A-factor biosynthesis hotdog domain